MSDETIRDIPSIQELLQQAQGMKTLKQFLSFPLIKPIFNLLGIDINKMKNDIEMIDELAKQAEELSHLPDSFNDHFLIRGWILYEGMNLEVAKKAVTVADSGDIDKAERILIEHFNFKTISFGINHQLKRIKAFHHRIRLAKLALKDYEEERYHACIPVVLALMDGLVNELNGGRGFFAEKTELEAWDSIAAHKKGLVELVKIFKKGRYKTCTEELTLPYRHGIMHGNDIGYDNIIVAAKTWAALFAVSEWALKAEKGELEEPIKEPEPTLMETFTRHLQTQKDKEVLNQWQPNTLVVGKECPATGKPEDYTNESPEQKLVEFLTFWKTSNFGYMTKCIPTEKNISTRAMPKQVKEVYDDTKLLAFEIVEVRNKAIAATEIQVILTYKWNGEEAQKSHCFWLQCLNKEGKPRIRGTSEYDWYVRNWRYFNKYAT